jgi:hypothetical protein
MGGERRREKQQRGKYDDVEFNQSQLSEEENVDKKNSGYKEWLEVAG